MILSRPGPWVILEQPELRLKTLTGFTTRKEAIRWLAERNIKVIEDSEEWEHGTAYVVQLSIRA